MKERYWNPYLCGVLLGVVLFLSFLVTGHGLGASGGLARLLTSAIKAIAPSQVSTTGFFAGLGGGAKPPLSHWLVWEVAGVLVGGAISGYLAGRVRLETYRGPATSLKVRWLVAFAGGALVGWATQLSRGCTSGQALSGGAVLSAGSWAFMFAVFGGAYLLAYPVRKLWR
jgi:uncharacterized membrane protein YedE/YeeE